MSLLSTLELSQLRADQADYWPDTCTIQTVSYASDGMGGQTETWANTHTSVNCRLMPQRSARGEQAQGDQVQAETSWVLTVAQDQTIDETMRVVHSSETYEIVSLADTHSWKTAKRAFLRRLD